MLIIKGMIVGLGKVLPGVSGSMIAIYIGIYDKLIKSLYSPTKKENIIFLFQVGVGFVVSLLLCSRVILNLLLIAYSYTIFFFMGMIASMQKNIVNKIRNKRHLFFSFVIIFIFFLLKLLKFNFDLSLNEYLKYFFIGFIEVFSSIVPGLSGTSIFISLSVYEEVLAFTSNLFNIEFIFSSFDKVLFFGLGCFLSFFFTVRLVNIFINKFENYFFSCVFGFSIISFISIAFNTIKKCRSFADFVLSMCFFVTGYFLCFLCDKKMKFCVENNQM